MYSIETINFWLALGVVAMQIVGLALVVLFFLRKRDDFAGSVAFIERWGLWAGLLLTLAGTVLTLVYSEILGLPPCGWCWVQRVFLWPQIFLFAIALWRGDRNVADYSIAFSVFGGVVALYQHYLQMGGTSVIGCPSAGQIDCAQRFVFEFGYITFPLMSFSLFAFLIVLMLFVRRRA